MHTDAPEITGEINRSSPMPYYYQLQELLQTWMEENQIPPHTQIPSELELGERFEVSRTVVRQALLELERGGLIYRLKGRGSFVTQPKLRQQITELTSFTQDARERNTRPGAKVLWQEMQPAGETVAQHLQIAPQTPVFCLERIRTINGEPVALETAYLNFEGVENLLTEHFEDQSLYEILAVRQGIIPFQAKQEHEAAIVRSREAELLQLQTGAPVMLIARTTYTADARPVEFVKSVYRGDKYRFVTRLKQT
jgi:GntR family transcriptional regulator